LILDLFNLAFVDIRFAESSSESGLTAAGKVVDAVDAGRVVLAGVARTLVNVHLAVHA